MKIGAFDTAQQPLLIAEIGNNHEGDPAFALELVDAAVAAGADAVKVQIIEPLHLVNVAQAERIAQLTRFRLKPEVFMEMATRVRARGRLFMASVFDCGTLVNFQHHLDAIKIASGDLDFDPLLEIAAASGRPVVLSTGMSTLQEIARAVDVLGAASNNREVFSRERLAVLHCVSLYPTPLEHANLAAIPQLAARLGVTVGYSDHTLGIEAALVALAFGAQVIEKHFTLDKTRSTFRDHALSMEPTEFAQLARAMRTFKSMVGSGARDDVISDAETRAVARRSLVAAHALPAGTVLELAHLDYVRPTGGLPPSAARGLIGRRLRRDVAHHELLQTTDFE